MNVEQTLTDELRIVAGTVDTPPPPAVTALARAADRAHRHSLAVRIATGALVAAAVVLAVVLGTQVDGPNTAPAPAPSPSTLPTGPPPTVAYLKAGTLFIGDRPQTGMWSTVVSSSNGVTTMATRSSSGRTADVVLFRDGSQVGLVANAVQDQSVLSEDGTKAAWVELVGGSVHLIVRDLISGQDLGRLAVGASQLAHLGPESEAWERVMSVGNGGTVTYGGVAVLHTWTPGSEPVDHDPQVPGGPAGFPDDAVDVHLSPDHHWGAWNTDRHGRPDPYEDEPWTADGVTFQRPGEPGTRFTIALPAGAAGQGLIWESATHVLVTVSDDPDGVSWHFLRCSVSDRHCEYAPTGGAD